MFASPEAKSTPNIRKPRYQHHPIQNTQKIFDTSIASPERKFPPKTRYQEIRKTAISALPESKSPPNARKQLCHRLSDEIYNWYPEYAIQHYSDQNREFWTKFWNRNNNNRPTSPGRLNHTFYVWIAETFPENQNSTKIDAKSAIPASPGGKYKTKSSISALQKPLFPSKPQKILT